MVDSVKLRQVYIIAAWYKLLLAMLCYNKVLSWVLVKRLVLRIEYSQYARDSKLETFCDRDDRLWMETGVSGSEVLFLL